MAKKKTPADGDLQAQSEKELNCQGHNNTETEKQQEIKEIKAWEMPDLDDPKYAEALEGKARNFIFIVYPESAPSDWIERITALHLPWAMSPLHDKDTNPDDTPKKPHYHCILQYPNTTPIKAFAKLILPITHGAMPQNCRHVGGAYRYFTHRDNPEKYQYETTEIKEYNGFETRLDEDEIDEIIDAIELFCIEKHLTDYAKAKGVIKKLDRRMSKVFRRNTIHFRAWFASYRNNPFETEIAYMTETMEDYDAVMESIRDKNRQQADDERYDKTEDE